MVKLLFPLFVKAAKRKKRVEEGWEYARLPQFSYHTTEHTLDLARRRRWHRKLVNVDPSKRPIFYFADEKKKKKVEHSWNVPLCIGPVTIILHV